MNPRDLIVQTGYLEKAYVLEDAVKAWPTPRSETHVFVKRGFDNGIVLDA